MDVVTTEDEIQVTLTHLETLLEQTHDVELLKEVIRDLTALHSKTSGIIANLYRTNKKTHYLCRQHTTKQGTVIYGYGEPDEDGRPMVICHECTEKKND